MTRSAILAAVLAAGPAAAQRELPRPSTRTLPSPLKTTPFLPSAVVNHCKKSFANATFDLSPLTLKVQPGQGGG